MLNQSSKEPGGSRCLVLGTFDLVHDEHLYFLNQAARLGDVFVGLGTDTYQQGYKRSPVLTFEERKRVLVQLPQVAGIVAREEVSIVPLLDEVQPDYLVAGVDWVDGPFLELSGISKETLADRRVNLVYVCSPRRISTTQIIERIRT